MPGQIPSLIAGANLYPSRFVKLLAGSDHTAVPCVAGDQAWGISHEGTRVAPTPDNTDGYAAITGESVRIYGHGEPCEIVAGAAVTAGDKLKPDADGKAVPAVAGNVYSAEALASAAIGEKVKVQIVRGTLPV